MPRFSANFSNVSVAAACASALAFVESITDLMFPSIRLFAVTGCILDSIWLDDSGVEPLEATGVSE